MIGMTMKANLKNFNKRVKLTHNPKPMVRDIAEQTLGHILKNVSRGLAGDGTPLERYSSRYAARKPGAPNLRVTGAMLDSLAVRSINKYTFRIGPSGSEMAKFRAVVSRRPILSIDNGNLNKFTLRALKAQGIGV